MPGAYADKKCGVGDPKAKFPMPVHYDCKECRKKVIEALGARAYEQREIIPLTKEKANE